MVQSKKDLTSGDILFLISCSEILSREDRSKFKKTLLIHASDLPKGRGWSPHIWEIINNAKHIVISLLEVEDKVDTGDIWKKKLIKIPSTALFADINELIFNTETDLMDFAIENIDSVSPIKQEDIKPTYWPKRMPKDSEIDVYKSLDEQFNLIRVSDPIRFPAFFYKNCQKVKLNIQTIEEIPKGKEIDIHKSIVEQFNLKRVRESSSDLIPLYTWSFDYFPIFFNKNGKNFKLNVEVADE